MEGQSEGIFLGRERRGRLCQLEGSVNEHGVARAQVRGGGG